MVTDNTMSDLSSSSWAFPLMLSCLAGASTCFGAAVVFCFEPSRIRRSMAFSLSLAASVMITITLVSILPEVLMSIWEEPNRSNLNSTRARIRPTVLVERLCWFGVGVGAYLLLAKLMSRMPDPEHLYLLDDPGEEEDYKRNYDLYLTDDDGGIDEDEEDQGDRKSIPLLVRRKTKQTSGLSLSSGASKSDSSEGRLLVQHHCEETGEDFSAFSRERRKRSWRVALMLFVSLLIHNFPEGLCVAASAKKSPDLGITVAIGIFIHNVPEGIAISVPCIAARPDRPWLAFWLASASGLAEPVGAAVALFFLGENESVENLTLENVLAFVAGVMITVAFWELYPEAIEANQELQRSTQHQKMRGRTGGFLPWNALRNENRSIIWGTIVGAALMIATELYLP